MWLCAAFCARATHDLCTSCRSFHALNDPGGSCQAGPQPRLGAAGPPPAGVQLQCQARHATPPPRQSHERTRKEVCQPLNRLVSEADASPSTGISAVRRPGAVVSAHRDFPLSVDIDWVDRQDNKQDQVLYRLAVQTGLRRGELLGLLWSDVDWEARSLTVEQQLYDRRQGSGQFGPPKTRASRRTIDLSEDTLEALNEWRREQGKGRHIWAELYDDLGLVFCQENGRPHDPRAITRRFPHRVVAAAVKRIRFDDLRHTSAVIGPTGAGRVARRG